MTVKEVAGLMVQNRISALPVVTDSNEIIGIISESDLLHRKETGTEKSRPWWVKIFNDPDRQAADFVKAHGRFVQDVMTRIVVTVPEDMPVSKIADLLETHRVRRVPVSQEGRVVGIVSRTDIVRAFAEATATDTAERVSNGALNKSIHDALQSQSLVNAVFVNYTIDDGVVTLMGFVDTDNQRNALRVLLEELPGVKRVDDQMRRRTWEMSA